MNKEFLYTLIINYKEGIYIYQVNSINELEAFKTWANSINDKTYEGLKKKDIKKLFDRIENDPPLLIDNSSNCWCADIPNIKGNYLSVNIVKTCTV
jgi:hypothetical protein